LTNPCGMTPFHMQSKFPATCIALCARVDQMCVEKQPMVKRPCGISMLTSPIPGDKRISDALGSPPYHVKYNLLYTHNGAERDIVLKVMRGKSQKSAPGPTVVSSPSPVQQARQPAAQRSAAQHSGTSRDTVAPLRETEARYSKPRKTRSMDRETGPKRSAKCAPIPIHVTPICPEIRICPISSASLCTHGELFLQSPAFCLAFHSSPWLSYYHFELLLNLPDTWCLPPSLLQ
jgi:hypothetical protein